MTRLATALVLASLLGSNSAFAQAAKPKVGDRIGAWTFQCQALSAEDTVCALVQISADAKTNRQLMKAVVHPVGKEKDRKLRLVVTLPLGIFLATGIAGKIDEGKQFNFVLLTCRQNGCEAAVDIDDKMKRAMRAGKQLVVAFKPRPNSDAFGVRVSLDGFTVGVRTLESGKK